MPEQLELLAGRDPWPGSSHSNELSVRISKRARQMFLHVRPPMGVELVVPFGTRPRTVEAFVRSHRSWIDAAHARIAREYSGELSPRPDSVSLPALGRHVRVAYRFAPDHARRWLADESSLTLHCRDGGCDDAPMLLRAWFMELARCDLPQRVISEAERLGQCPRRVQVRLQRTRWGSCSAHGTISVNASVLFLDSELVRYLIVHELCHMAHMNHSKAFWRLVSRFEPDYERLDAELARSWRRIPLWVMRER